MSDDLVERLRDPHATITYSHARKAADEIERLREQTRQIRDWINEGWSAPTIVARAREVLGDE